MNFSAIPSNSLLGAALRYPLRWIPKDLVVPILQGPLRGKKWIIDSSTHGCWLGSYEYEKQHRFAETVKPGAVVYDIGAHVGFYTLLASHLVGPSGKVVAFEPAPRNLVYLHRHIRLNNCSNVVIVEAAVSDEGGRIRFDEGPSSSMGFVSERGNLEVKEVALDELYSSRLIPTPDVIKMDVEGGGVLRLDGSQTSPV